MPLLKTPALVGPVFDLGDKDLVVHLLTPEHGRLGVVVRGGKASSKGRAAAFQSLSEVEVTAYHREGADLATLREAAILESHAGLRNDVDRLALASYLFDLALATALPGEDAAETYELVRHALGHCETAEESPPLTVLCHWLLRFLALHGVEPAIDEALLTGAWKGGRQAPPASNEKRKYASNKPSDIQTSKGKSQGEASADTGLASQSPPSGRRLRKPMRFLLYIAEGLIVAAPGEPGARIPPSATQQEDTGSRRPAAGGPRAYALAPAAVRAVYENQRTDTESLPGLPPIDPAAVAGLLRALAALAAWHLDLHPRSWRFLETTVLKRCK